MLDDFGNFRESELTAGFFNGALQCFVDNAGARDADINHHIGFAHTEIGSRHKRHVLRNVAEHNELGAADAVAVGRCIGCFHDFLAHEAYGIHVDAALGRAHIDRRADAIGCGQGFRQRIDEIALAWRHAFFYQGAEASDEVHADFFGAFVEDAADAHHLIGRKACANRADGRDGDALVDDGNAVAVAYAVAGFHQTFGVLEDLAAHFKFEDIEIVARAVEKVDAERYRAHIEMLAAKHIDS